MPVELKVWLSNVFAAEEDSTFPFNADEIAQIRLAHFSHTHMLPNQEKLLTQFSAQEIKFLVDNRLLISLGDFYMTTERVTKIDLYRDRALTYVNEVLIGFDSENPNHVRRAVLAAMTNYGDIEQRFSATEASPSKKILFEIQDARNSKQFFQYTCLFNYENETSHFHLGSQPVNLSELDLAALPRFPCVQGHDTPPDLPKHTSLSLDAIMNYTGSGHLIFVITTRGELVIDRSGVNHHYLGNGRPVLAAGEIHLKTVNGKKEIDYINDRSGHYMLESSKSEGHAERIKHFTPLIDSVFPEAGLTEARGKYHVFAAPAETVNIADVLFDNEKAPQPSKKTSLFQTNEATPAIATKEPLFDLETLPRFPCSTARTPPQEQDLRDKKPIKSLSIDDIRSGLFNSLTTDDIRMGLCGNPLIYVITTSGELLIEEDFFEHHRLGQYQPVLAAGAIGIEHDNGMFKIAYINDQSGAYMLDSYRFGNHIERTKHFPQFVEQKFLEAGYLEATGKYSNTAIRFSSEFSSYTADFVASDYAAAFSACNPAKISHQGEFQKLPGATLAESIRSIVQDGFILNPDYVPHASQSVTLKTQKENKSLSRATMGNDIRQLLDKINADFASMGAEFLLPENMVSNTQPKAVTAHQQQVREMFVSQDRSLPVVSVDKQARIQSTAENKFNRVDPGPSTHAEQIKHLGERYNTIDQRLSDRSLNLSQSERVLLATEHRELVTEIKAMRQGQKGGAMSANEIPSHEPPIKTKLPIGIRAVMVLGEGLAIGLGGEAVGQGLKNFAESLDASKHTSELAYHAGGVGGATAVGYLALGLTGPALLFIAGLEGINHAADYMDNHEAETAWGKLGQAPVQVLRDLIHTAFSPLTGTVTGMFQAPSEIPDMSSHIYFTEDGLAAASPALANAMLKQITQSIAETFRNNLSAVKKHIIKLGDAVLELKLPLFDPDSGEPLAVTKSTTLVVQPTLATSDHTQTPEEGSAFYEKLGSFFSSKTPSAWSDALGRANIVNAAAASTLAVEQNTPFISEESNTVKPKPVFEAEKPGPAPQLQCTKDRLSHRFVTPEYVSKEVLEKQKTNGDFLYVISEKGKVMMARQESYTMDESGRYLPASHIDLTSGRKIMAAGSLKVQAGKIVSIDSHAADYAPTEAGRQVSASRVKQVTEEVFRRQGFKAVNDTFVFDARLKAAGAKGNKPTPSMAHTSTTTQTSSQPQPLLSSSTFFYPQQLPCHYDSLIGETLNSVANKVPPVAQSSLLVLAPVDFTACQANFSNIMSKSVTQAPRSAAPQTFFNAMPSTGIMQGASSSIVSTFNVARTNLNTLSTSESEKNSFKSNSSATQTTGTSTSRVDKLCPYVEGPTLQIRLKDGSWTCPLPLGKR